LSKLIHRYRATKYPRNARHFCNFETTDQSKQSPIGPKSANKQY
jgi:hypothetical protein